jgi:hypothetical protein
MSDSEARAELEQAVEALLASTRSHASRPVNLQHVARHLGVDIQERSGTAEGRLCLKGGKATVEIAPTLQGARRRFTIAHELGHAFLLHPDRSLNSATVRRWPTEEAFCNDFAATILLPRTWLKEHLDDRAPSLSALLELAYTSRVSPTACALRLLNSGLWQHGLLVLARTETDTWWLRTSVGLSRRKRAKFSLAAETASLLTRLKRSDRHRSLLLDLHLDDTLRSLKANVAFSPQACIAFIMVQGKPGAWEPAWLPNARRQLSLFDDCEYNWEDSNLDPYVEPARVPTAFDELSGNPGAPWQLNLPG